MTRILEEDVRAVAQHSLDWEKLSGARVVVTGAGGFLGSAVARTLLALYRLGKVARPVQVVAMVRDVDKARVRFEDLPNAASLELLRWDLNAIAVPDLGDVNYIVHAASQASPRFYGSDPVGTLMPNVVGTAALLEALGRSSAARGFLFVSSSEVYGAVSGDATLAETDYGVIDPINVRACYSESKRMGEAMCVAWHHQRGMPTFIVRPFHTYGPGLLPEDGRVFADFVFNVIRNENIVMNSDGTARRAFCYVADAVAGFFTVLLSGTPTLPYNVANCAGELSVMELADMLVAMFPEKRLHVERRFALNDKSYIPSVYNRLIPNVDRLHSLGWSARTLPQHGFKRMIEAYQ